MTTVRTVSETDFSDEYLIHKELNSARQYKTFSAMTARSDGTPYAVILKEIDEKRAAVYDALSHMWNPHTAEVYEVLKVGGKYLAVTECVYARGCERETMSLAEFVGKNGAINRGAALNVCVQLCEGLEEIHKAGIVHRDLKPENIMLSKYSEDAPEVKIIDFGGAKTHTGGLSDTTVVGTLGYQAPESLSSSVTNRADIYSIGCILNFMLTGHEPGLARFRGDHRIAAVIEKAANEDPSHRYADVAALRRSLEHELGTRLIDRIPLLRGVPGFRTHTLWKEFIAAFSYISMIFIFMTAYDKFGIRGVLETLVFYVIIPLVVCFNMGDMLRFVPETIRRDNLKFMMTRTAVVLFSVFAPIIIDNIIAG